MKFTVNTKPLVDALALAIIQSNVSQYYARSTIAQITASRDELIINTEASSTLSEVHVKGSGDDDVVATTFVSSVSLKQLVTSFDTSTITVEFVERPTADGEPIVYDGVILHSGKSKFTLANVTSDEADNSLTRPNQSYMNYPVSDLNQPGWKFVQSHQMFSIGMSFTNPAYTMVWIGEDGDVIVGDYDKSVFTHSVSSKLGVTCLLSDTILNLFTVVPEDSKVYRLDRTYVLESITDSYKFISEFMPKYEEDIGSYNSDIIMSTMPKTTENSIKLDLDALNKFMSQANILSTGVNDTIQWKVTGDKLDVDGEFVDYHASVQCEDPSAQYEMKFNFDQIRSALNKLDESVARICPLYRDDEVVGINVWTEKLTIVLAGAD